MYRVLTIPALFLGLALAAGQPAMSQEGQQAAEPRVWISPSEGATQTLVRLSAEGLPGLSDVLVLAGQDPDRLFPVARGATDARGGLTMELRVPEQAERGQSYYFALDPGGESGPVVADPPFQVLVRENAPPGGA